MLSSYLIIMQGGIYALFLYDATYLYLTMLQEFIAEGKPIHDGKAYLQKAKKRTFHGNY